MQKQWAIDDNVVQLCKNKQNWLGSFYELGVAFNPRDLDEQRRSQLLQTLWSDPQLQGIVSDQADFGQLWLNSQEASIINGQHSYGCIHLMDGNTLGCASCFVSTKEVSWLLLYMPLAMLGLVYPVTYPLINNSQPWMLYVNNTLVQIAMRLYPKAPFELGVLGEEAGALPFESLQKELETHTGLLVPEALFQRSGVIPHGLRFPEGLWWTGGRV